MPCLGTKQQLKLSLCGNFGHIFQRHRPPTVIFTQIQHHATNQSATDPGGFCGRPNSNRLYGNRPNSMFFRAKFNDLAVSKLPPKWCFKREMFHSTMVCIYTSNSTNYVHVQTTATTITTIGWASPALEHPKGRFLLDILVFRRKTTPSVHPWDLENALGRFTANKEKPYEEFQFQVIPSWFLQRVLRIWTMESRMPSHLS